MQKLAFDILNLAIVFLIFYPAVLFAQDDDTLRASSLFDTVSNNGDSCFVISDIILYGNKKTKSKIIMRELEFAVRDTLCYSQVDKKIEQSRQNLLKTSLFNYVTITYQPLDYQNNFLINILVEERWYIWPQVDIAPHNGNLNDWLRDPEFDKIDYSFGVKKYNFRGRKESIFINFRRGFNNITQIGYSDIAVERSRKNLLGFSAEIIKRKSGILKIYDNNAKYIDIDGASIAFKEYQYKIVYTYRPKINIRNSLEISYANTKIHDSVAFYNPEYLGEGRTKIQAVNLSYVFSYDKRNSSYYPLSGEFFKAMIGKRGLLFDDIDFYNGVFDCRVYRNLGEKFYFASQCYYSWSSSSTPFYYREAFGTKPNVVPGYEKRQICGTHLGYLQTSYKYELLKTHILELKKINVPKFNKIHYAFYINFFANCGYVSRESSDDDDFNDMNGAFLGAIGLGLDLVTYYDRVFSVYYTRNIQGDGYLGVGIKTFF